MPIASNDNSGFSWAVNEFSSFVQSRVIPSLTVPGHITIKDLEKYVVQVQSLEEERNRLFKLLIMKKNSWKPWQAKEKVFTLEFLIFSKEAQVKILVHEYIQHYALFLKLKKSLSNPVVKDTIKRLFVVQNVSYSTDLSDKMGGLKLYSNTFEKAIGIYLDNLHELFENKVQFSVSGPFYLHDGISYPDLNIERGIPTKIYFVLTEHSPPNRTITVDFLKILDEGDLRIDIIFDKNSLGKKPTQAFEESVQYLSRSLPGKGLDMRGYPPSNRGKMAA